MGLCPQWFFAEHQHLFPLISTEQRTCAAAPEGKSALSVLGCCSVFYPVLFNPSIISTACLVRGRWGLDRVGFITGQPSTITFTLTCTLGRWSSSMTLDCGRKPRRPREPTQVNSRQSSAQRCRYVRTFIVQHNERLMVRRSAQTALTEPGDAAVMYSV